MPAARLQPLLRTALGHLKAGRRPEAAAAAAKALDLDETCGLAWHILAICREKVGDFAQSLKCYEQAYALTPDEPEIANDLGRLALKMGMAEIAEALFANYVARRPDSVEGVNNLACAQRDRLAFDRAIETLSAALSAHPDRALLWNALASVLTLQGEMEKSLVFYDEALRLQPDFAIARHNRSVARLATGDAAGALEDLDEALAGARTDEAANIAVAKAKALLACGRLAEGWEAYKARLDPAYSDTTMFVIEAEAWNEQAPAPGDSLLLVAEQGLGDEVMFAQIAPDLLDAIGPTGRLGLAVDPRLVSLMARSFPTADVMAHATHRVDHRSVRSAPLGRDYPSWAPIAAPMKVLRGRPEDFARAAYLRPDPERVAAFRGALAALPGLKVGILWKSLVMDAERIRQFAPFASWEPVLATPDVTFVNLQYGDTQEEEALCRQWGVQLWRPPGLDLKDDLEGVAALTSALDVTLGPANATTNIAGACGADVWFISTPWAWPRLGRDDYPWYPQAEVFTPEAYTQWGAVMKEVAAALAKRARTS